MKFRSEGAVMISPEGVKALAIRKFGDKDWLVKLSREIGVHHRTVRRWAQGEIAITPRIEREIRRACE